MDTEKCDVLLSVLEEGSLSAAADKLGYTPSGISRIIAGMEKETGLPLLLRGREGIQATRELEELLPAVREISYWGKYLQEKARSIRGIETGTVMAGAVYSVYYPWLCEMVAGFSSLHPGIRIGLLEGTSSEMAGAIEQRKGDFCIISRREGDFRFIPLIRDEVVAILPRDHPLARAGAFPVIRYAEEPFIQLYPHSESDTSILLNKYNVTPNIRYTTEDLFAGYAMVEAGLGVSMENGVTARPLSDRVAVLPLEPEEYMEIGIAIPREDVISPAAAAFAAYALQRMPKDGHFMTSKQ